MRLRCLLFCLLGLLIAGGAKAQLVLTLDQTQVTALPGDTVTFDGNVQNTSGSDLYLNGAEFTQLDLGLTGDVTPFLNNTPAYLTPGEMLPNSVPFFTITLDSSLQPGMYGGTFEVLGGPDDMTYNSLATADFQIDIAPLVPPAVPEPGNMALLIGLATAGTALLRKRRK